MAKLTSLQREQIRQERRLRDIEAIKLLRKHIRGYEASAGYDIRHMERLTSSQRRYLRKKYTKLVTLLSQPYDVIKPKDKQERRALRHFTQQRFLRAKHFIVHKPDPETKVTLEKGAVTRSEEHTSELQSRSDLVCRLLLEKKK